MRTSDYRAAARAVLQGKWLKTAAILLLASLLGAMVGSATGNGVSVVNLDFDFEIPLESLDLSAQEFRMMRTTLLISTAVMVLYALFLGSYVTVGLAGLGSRVLDGENPRVGMLFPRGIYWKTVGMSIVRCLLISFWSIFLVIPGIVTAYNYSMADYILYTHPEMGVMEVLRESKKRMYGHRLGLLVLELSFIGWALLASLPALVAVYAVNPASFWVIYGVGTIVSMLASIFVQTYMHVSFIAYFRNVDRASVWHNQARAGEEEFIHSRFGEGEPMEEEVPVHTEPEPYVDVGVARSLFMEYGCSHAKLRDAGMMEEYEQMHIDSSMEMSWIRDYAQSLMLRFNRDALTLDALLTLAGEYAMDDLVSRVLERIERHIRQQTLPDAEIMNMAGRVLALLVSGAFADNPGFVQRKKQQISDMAERLAYRLESADDGSWQEALRLIRGMCEQ